MYVIYHESTNRSFQYDGKTMQFKQISFHECELYMRHLLCQDMIFKRIKGANGSDRQGQSLNYVDRQMKLQKFVTMKKFQERDILYQIDKKLTYGSKYRL